jgi:predicted esterase
VIKKALKIASVFVFAPAAIGGLLSMTYASSFRGFGFCFAVFLVSVLSILMLFNILGKTKRRLPLLVFLGLIFYLSAFVMTAPSGESHSTGISHQNFNNSAFDQYALWNMLPEIDQLSWGATALSFIDRSLSAEKAARLDTSMQRIYDEMNATEDFTSMGTVLGFAYDEILSGSFKTGHYFRYVPSNQDEKPMGVIVFCHGSLGNFKGYQWVLAQVAEQSNCVIISPSYGMGNWNERESSEVILNALDHLKTQIKVDESATYIAGISNGGLGATIVAAQHPELFCGMILLTPVMHPSAIQTPRFAEGWKGKPICVIAGAKDARVPIELINSQAQLLEKSGANVTLQSYEDDHFLLFTSQNEVTARLLNWLSTAGRATELPTN